MMDWLKVHNEADIIPFIKAIDKTCKQYYPDELICSRMWLAFQAYQ